MLSNDIASLSTGKYYKRVGEWYEMLKTTLEKYNCVLSEMPTIHTREGSAYIEFFCPFNKQEGVIYFTWYRMESGNWEIICYKC